MSLTKEQFEKRVKDSETFLNKLTDAVNSIAASIEAIPEELPERGVKSIKEILGSAGVNISSIILIVGYSIANATGDEEVAEAYAKELESAFGHSV